MGGFEMGKQNSQIEKAHSMRRRAARAFSRWRATASDWSKRSCSTLAASLFRAAKATESSFHVFNAVGPHPPLQASATRGKNCKPSDAQVAKVC